MSLSTGWLWCNTREQLGSFDVDVDEQLANMAHDLKERGVEFAIFDVLNPLHSRPENDNTEMAQVVERISQMGRDAGCSIDLIHHVSKENGSGGRFFTRIGGASAIHGWTEWGVSACRWRTPTARGASRFAGQSLKPKAAESCAPISFTVQFGGGNLHLKTIDPKPFQPGTNDSTRYRD